MLLLDLFSFGVDDLFKYKILFQNMKSVSSAESNNINF